MSEADYLYYHPAAHTGPAYTTVPSGTPDRFAGLTVQSDHRVRMRDGVHLATDVYLPDAPGPFPAVLIRLPYGKIEPVCAMPLIARFWARKGYACVVQDIRGKWGSEGVFVPAVGKTEVDDGYDTIAWIAAQPFCNGSVGMYGESYYGFTSYAGAVGGHPALKCIAPGNISVDRYRNIYRGGAFQFNTMGNWALSMDVGTVQDVRRIDPWRLPLRDIPATGGLAGNYFLDLITHPRRGPFWEARSLLQAHEKVTIPLLCWTGWYDTFLGQQLTDWDIIWARNSARRHCHLFIGPWDHEGSFDQIDRIGGIWTGTHGEHRWDTYQAFFDHYLMGLDNGFNERPPVEIFTLNGSWGFLSAWPPKEAVPTPFYLAGNGAAPSPDEAGRLAITPPGAEPPDSYDYDPLDPVADTVEASCWGIARELGDRRSIEQRPDVLVYSTEPLIGDVEVTGPVKATLFAASSAVDTDFWIGLVDVREDGYATLVQDGILRASARDGIGDAPPLEPGKPVRFDIDLWAASIVFRKGHRIRVEVSSSAFSKYARNTNSGEPAADAARVVVARQAIHHDAAHPSHILLPVIGRPAAVGTPSAG
jgi:putative CocE/NonD family hydrolase